MASRIKYGAILIRRKDPGYIDLGDDVIVIPRFRGNWEKFIKEINEVYKKYTALNDDNHIGSDIRILE